MAHGVEVEKIVLRLYRNGFTKMQICDWFAAHYKGGYKLSHPVVSNMIRKCQDLEKKHKALEEMTKFALDLEAPSNKIEEGSIPASVSDATTEPASTPIGAGSFYKRPIGEIVLAIPDLHCPFQHPDSLEFLKSVRDTHNVTKIICLGDEIDAHALSKYPKDPDGFSAGQEIKAARESLEKFYVAFPEVLVCESNHTVRGHKAAFSAGLPQSFLRNIETVLGYPDGWRLEHHHEIDGVRYFHGDAGCSGFTAHIQYMRKFKQSCVIGHIHSYGGVGYEGQHFGMNAGCLIDTDAYCFKYAKHLAIPVSLGCGIVKRGQSAQFVPMELDENGRWTGAL